MNSKPRPPAEIPSSTSSILSHFQDAAEDAEDGVPDDRIQLPHLPLKRTGVITPYFKFQANRLRIRLCGSVHGQKLERCARKSSSYLAGLGVIAAAFVRGPAPTSQSGAGIAV